MGNEEVQVSLNANSQKKEEKVTMHLPVIDSPMKDESESESGEEEEGIPSSDDGKQKKKPVDKSCVEKNERSDTKSDGTEPKQMERKENDSTSEGEATVENQKKASDEVAEQSNELAAEKGEETLKDGKQKKSLVDSDDKATDGSDSNHGYLTEKEEGNGKRQKRDALAVKGKGLAGEAKRSSSRIPDDTVAINQPRAKRAAENDDEKEPETRHSKRAATETDYARHEAMKLPFQRVWRQRDESILLKGLITYCKTNNVTFCSANMKLLLDFIEEFCNFHFKPTRKQVRTKIRKLEKKYDRNSVRVDRSIMEPHEKELFKLSRKVWGNVKGVAATKATANAQAEMVTKVQDAPQKSMMKQQLEELRMRQRKVYLKRLELMEEEKLLDLGISKLLSRVMND